MISEQRKRLIQLFMLTSQTQLTPEALVTSLMEVFECENQRELVSCLSTLVAHRDNLTKVNDDIQKLQYELGKIELGSRV